MFDEYRDDQVEDAFEDVIETLESIQKEYPCVFRWFFFEKLLEIKKKNDSIRNSVTPRETGRTG